MTQYKLDLTIDVLEVINDLRLKGATLKIRQKAGTIYYRALGKTIDFIKFNVGIKSNKTITEHVKNFLNNGIAYLEENNYKGHPSKLEDFANIIIEEFEKDQPGTINEARLKIEELTGLKRGNTQVAIFLKKKGFRTKNQEQYQQRQMEKNNKNS